MASFEELAMKFPNGLSQVPELPEERSGEVSRPIMAGMRAPLADDARRHFGAVAQDAMEEQLV